MTVLLWSCDCFKTVIQHWFCMLRKELSGEIENLVNFFKIREMNQRSRKSPIQRDFPDIRIDTDTTSCIIYLWKVNIGNTWKMCERHHRRWSGVFTVLFKQTWHIVLQLPSLSLRKYVVGWNPMYVLFYRILPSNNTAKFHRGHYYWQCWITLFLPDVSFWFPWKHPKNLWFSDVFGKTKREHCEEKGKPFHTWFGLKNPTYFKKSIFKYIWLFCGCQEFNGWWKKYSLEV